MACYCMGRSHLLSNPKPLKRSQLNQEPPMKAFKYVADPLTRSVEVLALLFGLSVSFPLGAKQVTVLKNVNIIDGTVAEPQRRTTVIIAGDRIQSISPRPANPPSDATVPSGSTVIDMEGLTIMPLMINTHGHLGLVSGTSQS